MPHISIKMMPGRTDAQKQALADAIVKTMIEATGVSETSLSVAIEDIPRREWDSTVFVPEIAGKKELLFKKPGYKDV